MFLASCGTSVLIQNVPSSLTADTTKRRESEQESSAESKNLLAVCTAAINEILSDTPSVDLSRDRTAQSGKFPEDE